VNKTTAVLLVLLRIAIGWHFLYEGVFKLASDGSAVQWNTSRYFLQTSTARLRDDLNQGAGAARLDQWYEDVVAYFKRKNSALAEDQKARLAVVRDGLKAEPASAVDWIHVHEEVLKLTADKPVDPRFTAEPFLLGSTGPFRPLFRALVSDADGLARLSPAVATARIEDRYREILSHFRTRGYALTTAQQARLALVRDDLKRSLEATLEEPTLRTRVADYKLTLDRVAAAAPRASTPYLRERLQADRKRLDLVAVELLAFVNEPLMELSQQANSIASVEQLQAGPVPPPHSQTVWIDWSVKWGLIVLGLLLMAGLFTTPAAAGAAVMLAMFYLGAPPWPGLPEAPGTSHFLYVNTNLIEIVAVLAIAASGTAKWGGLDRMLARIRDGWKVDRQVAVAAR
jgi:uncharacterized membrane protein YphA (DoxX/SURF4 family)